MYVLPIREGQRTDGSKWVSQDFVFEFKDASEHYYQRMVLSLMNEDVDHYQLKPGEKLTLNVTFNAIEGRDNRYFNSLRVRKIEPVVEGTEAIVTEEPATDEPF